MPYIRENHDVLRVVVRVVFGWRGRAGAAALEVFWVLALVNYLSFLFRLPIMTANIFLAAVAVVAAVVYSGGSS
jgi:hypothetical protein